MKLIYYKMAYLLIGLFLLQGCERQMMNGPSADQEIIKDWYQKQNKSFDLDWSKLEVVAYSNTKTFLQVPLVNGLNLGPDNAVLQTVLFSMEKDGSINAQKLDLFADITAVTRFDKEIISSYISRGVYTNSEVMKSHVITYDLQNNYLSSVVISKDEFRRTKATIQQERAGSASETNNAVQKSKSMKRPLKSNIPVECKDWYLVKHFDDGSSEWYYWYTTCSSNGGGGSGGGNGSSGGGTGGATYYYESPAEPINIQDLMNCFNNIPTTSETIFNVTIHTHLANPALTTQVYNFTEQDPGHAYITLEKTTGNTSRSLTFGFYPLTDTWITGTKNAVGSAVGMEPPAERRSDARYSIGVNESTFNNVRNTAIARSSNHYDLNDYNCTDFALDIFNAAMPPAAALVVADSPIGFTTPSGLYLRLEQLRNAGTTGISTTPTNAPASNSPCN